MIYEQLDGSISIYKELLKGSWHNQEFNYFFKT